MAASKVRVPDCSPPIECLTTNAAFSESSFTRTSRPYCLTRRVETDGSRYPNCVVLSLFRRVVLFGILLADSASSAEKYDLSFSDPEPRVDMADLLREITVPDLHRGLEDVVVVVAGSSISDIDGDARRLVYRGYDTDDLARGAWFEKVLYLLWNGALPDETEIEAVR